MPTQYPTSSQPHRMLGWEPAVSQLRALAPPDLDRLVSHWLAALDLSAIRTNGRHCRCTTYQALLGNFPVGVPIFIRVYQRQNRLQVHHVEAFLGHLVRLGIPAGVLISTGDFSREAYDLASTLHAPRIRLLSGPAWAQDLADRRMGLRPRRLWAWLLDLSKGFADPVKRRRSR